MSIDYALNVPREPHWHLDLSCRLALDFGQIAGMLDSPLSRASNGKRFR